MLPALMKAFEQVGELLEPFENQNDILALEQHIASEGGGNGHKKQPGMVERVQAAREILHAIADQGVIVQDWTRGLVDFPHIRDGDEVFLCWEPMDGIKVRYYHDLSSGYAGRQPL